MKKVKQSLVRKVFSSYLNMLRPYSALAIIIFTCYACAFVCTEIVRPYIVKLIIDGHIDGTMSTLWAVVLFGVVALIYNLFFRGADYTNAPFEARMIKVLYDESLGRIMKHSPLFFVNFGDVGKIVTKVRRYARSFTTLFKELLFRVLVMGIYAIGVTAIAIQTDYRLGIVFLLFVSFFSFIVIRFFDKKMNLEEISTEKDSAIGGAVSDILKNVQTIKHYGRTGSELERYYKITEEGRKAEYNTEMFGNYTRVLKALIVMVFDITIVALLSYLYKKGEVTIGTVALFISYAYQISSSIWELDDGLKKITKAIADGGELIVDVFDRPLELPDSKDTVDAILDASITLEDISYSYGGSNQVFKGLSLHIPSGQKVGICGTTGSGKTTLVNLILRTMDPQQGAISIDTYSIKNRFSQDGLKKWISYVPQSIDMFTRTVMENIRVADPSKTDEQVIEAAKRAQIHEYIMSRDLKYESMVGQNGLTFSGGQRQRIAIARALLRDTPILILDEATSALDVMTQCEILDILNKEFVGKTVIVIAHRLSTIRNLDRILVLEHGKIIEDGDHYELMQQQGAYFGLVETENQIDDIQKSDTNLIH